MVSGRKELAIPENTPKVSRSSSSFHVFIDQKKKGGHTISDSSLSHKGHPQVTGMVPNVWIEGHAAGCGCPLGPTPSAAVP